MPELATPVRYGLSPPVFNPVMPPVVPLAVDTRKAGKAALYSGIAKVLADLPTTLLAAYKSGRELRQSNLAEDKYQEALIPSAVAIDSPTNRALGVTPGTWGGQSVGKPSLSDFDIAGGKISYKPEDPALRAAKVNYYNNRAVPKAPVVRESVWEKEMRELGLDPAEVPNPDLPAGSPSASVPIEGEGDDLFDGPIERTGVVTRSPALPVTRTPPATLADGVPITPHVNPVPDNPNAVAVRPVASRAPVEAPLPADPLMREIEGAAINIGDQLAGMEPEGMTAQTGAGAAPAKVTPVTRQAALETMEATNIPTAPGTDPTAVVVPPKGTKTVDPVTKAITLTTPEGSRYVLMPHSNAWRKEAPDTTKQGKIFKSAEDAVTAGYDPTDAEVLPDGTLRVTKFKSVGTDIKGRGKITDTQKKMLSSASEMAKELDGMQEIQAGLFEKGKSGPFAGRWNELLLRSGYGDAEFVEANGKLKVSNFKIARLLNGPGVLTDKDIERAQQVAPTLNETPDSFAAKMRAVKSTLRASIETWQAINAGQATETQAELANRALEALGGKAIMPANPNIPGIPALPAAAVPSAAPAATGAGTKDNPSPVNTRAEYDALPSGAWYKDSDGNIARKK